jgi:hypothetical protein
MIFSTFPDRKSLSVFVAGPEDRIANGLQDRPTPSHINTYQAGSECGEKKKKNGEKILDAQ